MSNPLFKKTTGGITSGTAMEKLIWPVLGTVLGGLITTIAIKWYESKSPELVVRQFYNTVELNKSVPTQIGGLIIEYQPETPKMVIGINNHSGEYVLEVANVGRGPEEDLRVQVQFPKTVKVNYVVEPNFKIFRVEEVTLNSSDFFMSLRQFPQYAVAPVIFAVEGEKTKLCETHIQIAGREKVGKVEPIKGVTCKP